MLERTSNRVGWLTESTWFVSVGSEDQSALGATVSGTSKPSIARVCAKLVLATSVVITAICAQSVTEATLNNLLFSEIMHFVRLICLKVCSRNCSKCVATHWSDV